jgi:hypothetical protein
MSRRLIMKPRIWNSILVVAALLVVTPVLEAEMDPPSVAPLPVATPVLGGETDPPSVAPCSSGYTDKVIKKYNKTCRLFDSCMLWKAGKIAIMPTAQFKALHKAMRDWWNWMVGNSWARIGPRYFEFGTQVKGNVLAPGTRLFYSVMPSHTNSRTVRLKHVGGKSRAIVRICVVDSKNGRRAAVTTWDIPKRSRPGKTYTYTIRNVSQKFVFVDIAGKTVSRNFKYTLTVN